MKERKRYQNPDIIVISIRENSDIIQTSGDPILTEQFTNLSGTSAYRVMNSNNDIGALFNTNK